MVGYVMICYGVCDAICSLAFTPLVKSFGRVPIFIFGACINVSLLILMLNWRPDPENIIVFFTIAALWGVADAIWQTQINGETEYWQFSVSFNFLFSEAFYGVIFPGASEAAFSNYRLWESLGFILAYNLSTYTCMTSKIYINMGILFVGMVGYLIIEFMEFRKKKNNQS